MHRFPKVFSNSPQPRSSSSTRPPAKPKKLDRCNASNNIHYDSSPSTSLSSSSSSSSSSAAAAASYSPDDSLRTRSAHDLYGSQTSFRVDGTDGGEFDVICRAFGFSGIDDFQISTEEYATIKVTSSSSSAPLVFTQAFDHHPIIYHTTTQDSDIVRGDSVGKDLQQNSDLSYVDLSRTNVISAAAAGDISNRFFDSVSLSGGMGFDENTNTGGQTGLRGRNGIKGLRPPLLAPPSLPTARPVITTECSIWNTLRDAPVRNFGRGYCLDDDDEATWGRIGSNSRDSEEDLGRMVREDNCMLLETCSLCTTSNDGDSSSTTTEPTSSTSPNVRFRRIFKDWQKGELLGRGSFGSVYEGIADDGFFFAVKEVCLLDQGDEGKQSILQLEQEIALLSQFQHENVVQYYGTKKDDSHLYIFLELVTKGSLLSLYQKYDMRVPQVSAYTRQILCGLKYLHDRDVVHRDIKCANILVHTNGLVKLADFGLAKAVKLNDAKSCKGTAFWMAPEVVRSQGHGSAADIWSLGCTVLEMLTRRFPYGNMECMAALFRIGKGERPPIPNSLSTEARDFILQCLQVNPGMRPTAAELLDHPFVKGPLPAYSNTASPQNYGNLG